MRKNELPGYRKKVLSWCFYDWANSAFATTIIAAILPVYYSKVIAIDIPSYKATAFWSYTVSIALLITALTAPLIGAIADHINNKKLFLKIFTALGILFTALLCLIKTGDLLFASTIFIVANVGFALSEIFYNSLLKVVAAPEDIDRISTLGYTLGYLGGGILLAINVIFFILLPNEITAFKLSFLSVSLWWGIFSVPIFTNLGKPVQNTKKKDINYLSAGFGRIKHTFREIRNYKQLFIFLIAFWIYNDGIGTIIKLATIYGTEIGIGTMSLIGALLMTQFVGVPFTFGFGKLSGYIGAKNCIYIGLVVYSIVSVAAYFISTAIHFWILAFVVGTVQGGTQALSRSFFSSMVPTGKTAEFFGFYGMSSKFAGIVGPLVFAIISQTTGDSRYSIISLIIFFLLGIFILSLVDEKKAKIIS